MYDDDNSVFAAIQAGARGYLLKGASKKEMLALGNSWVLGKPAIENKTSTGSAKRMLVCSGLPTVEWGPTLSAERITFRASSPAATLGERLSKC